jgi:hypothetical protein
MRRWWAIALCLLAGAVVNVLVAWGCDLWSTHTPYGGDRNAAWPVAVGPGVTPKPAHCVSRRGVGLTRHSGWR